MKKSTHPKANKRGKNQHSYKERPYTDPKWLQRLYWKEKKTTKEMAEIAGVSSAIVITNWMKKYDIPRRPPVAQKGNKNFKWNGGKYESNTGYRYILKDNHPRGFKKGSCYYVPEHTLVMEKHLGRHLTPKEVVHHINGDKLDNRIENLTLFQSNGEHISYEMKVSLFAKKLIWGDIKPELKKELQNIFEEFKDSNK